MDKYKKLLEMVQGYERDFLKFYVKGNKTAGIRLRKHMQELRAFAKNIRNEVQKINSERSEGEIL